MGSDVAEIHEAAPGEVVPAFRIHSSAPGYPATFDILGFNGKCWWPLSIPTRDEPRGEDNSTKALLNEFATLEWDILALLPRGVDRPSPVEETDLRFFDPAQRDAALDRARCKIRRNILLYNDRAYAVGGEPIRLTGPQHGSTGGVASSGAGRSVYLTQFGLRHPPGHFMSQPIQYQLRNGSFCAANDPDRFTDLVTDEKRQTSIQVLMPEMVGICRPQLRLDALFRLVVKLRDDCGRTNAMRIESGSDISMRLAMQSLELQEAVTGNDNAVTSARLQALDLVHPLLKDWPVSRYGYEYAGLYREISLFKEQESAFIAEHPRLTAEEDEALRSLSL